MRAFCPIPRRPQGPRAGFPGPAYSRQVPTSRRTEPSMPIATPETYAQMLDRAKEGRFAYPAINVTSSQTLNAALRGFAEAGSDGIVQVSTGGAEFLSGTTGKGKGVGGTAPAGGAAGGAEKEDGTGAPHP